jgi:hypothetical protein
MSEASGSDDRQLDLSSFAAPRAYGRALAQAWYKKQQGELHPFVRGELELYRWFAHVAVYTEVHTVEFEPHPGRRGFVRSVFYKNLLFASQVSSEEAILTLSDTSYVETRKSSAPPRGMVPAMFVTGNTDDVPREHHRTPLMLLDRIVWGKIGAEDDEELLESAVELADVVIEGCLDNMEALDDAMAPQEEFTRILRLCARSLQVGPPLCPRIGQTPEFIVPGSAYIPELS